MTAAKAITMYPVVTEVSKVEEPIPGGFYLKARCIQNSAIASAAPHVREIWDWLLKEAQHKDTKVSGTIIKRGQVFTDYNEISEGLFWHEGFIKKRYKKHHVDYAMRWLRQERMVTTEKTTRGVIITICNYERYQNISNYENANGYDNQKTVKRQSTSTINKNDKNDKNRSREFEPPTVEEVIAYFLEKGYSEESARKAHENYHVADWVDSKGNPVKNWKQKMNNVWFKEENRIKPETIGNEVDMDDFLDRPRVIPLEEL